MVMGERMNEDEVADVREIIRNATNDEKDELPPIIDWEEVANGKDCRNHKCRSEKDIWSDQRVGCVVFEREV